MKKIIAMLFFVVTFFACQESDKQMDKTIDIKPTKQKTKGLIIRYGYSTYPPEYVYIKRQIDSLENHYGFIFGDRGCVIPDSTELIKIESENDKVINELAIYHGKNWYLNYERQVDSLFKNIRTIKNIN